jgi:hypothetical protein
MRIKSIAPVLLFFFVFFIGTIPLSTQSLAELSKKEKERRAKLGGVQSREVTNSDLERWKNSPGKKILLTPAKTEAAVRIESVDAAAPPLSEETGAGTPGRPGDETAQEAKYATAVLPSSERVENPEGAVGEPDEDYATVFYWGWIDLEVDAVNGEGDDLAVYAERIATAGQDYTDIHYLVYAKKDENWVAIGLGTGITSPERFDLGDIKSTDVIRILYRNKDEVYQLTPNWGHANRLQFRMHIDAVEVLH